MGGIQFRHINSTKAASFLGTHGSQTFYQTPHLHFLEDELCDSCMFDLFYMAEIYQIIPTCNLLDATCWISPDEWLNGYTLQNLESHGG